MHHLIEIAGDNFEVDFGSIYRLGMTDPDPDVRATAISGLWDDTDPALIAPLIKIMQSDDADKPRAAAASALGRFVYEGEIEEIDASKVTPAVLALKTTHTDPNESVEVRRRALEALSFLGYDEVGALIEQAYRDPDSRMRLSAVFAMGRSSDQRWGEIVEQELDSTDPEMRYEAARACGEMQYAPAVKHVSRLVDDVDEDVQRAAVWALGQLGGDYARDILMSVLDSNAVYLHEEAEDALSEWEFNTGNLNFAMMDFGDDDDEEEWVLDEDFDDEEDDE